VLDAKKADTEKEGQRTFCADEDQRQPNARTEEDGNNVEVEIIIG
jgi:hypothetical protein